VGANAELTSAESICRASTNDNHIYAEQMNNLWDSEADEDEDEDEDDISPSWSKWHLFNFLAPTCPRSRCNLTPLERDLKL
jgi:hypothetical protein